MRQFLQRVGLVLAMAAIAALCLWSAWLAAAIGIVIAAIVALDMAVFAPAHTHEPPDQPDKLNVDLRRRP